MKDITVKLDIKPDSKPKFLKARPVPYAIRPKVEADLDALVKDGVLAPVSVSEWATPIVPVLKKDGSIRICGDFKVTHNPVLLVTHIDDLFAGLAGGQKFSKIYICQAYLQMHVDEKSRELLQPSRGCSGTVLFLLESHQHQRCSRGPWIKSWVDCQEFNATWMISWLLGRTMRTISRTWMQLQRLQVYGLYGLCRKANEGFFSHRWNISDM